ncbi:hypothetical protein ACFVAF_18305 [Streptomyces sp. NPDC057596]|uniref:hypothetical protein n=1 Tax=Streptomyces sp. NPDC057596 TaxID=3346178 RepID=UPI0036CEDB31
MTNRTVPTPSPAEGLLEVPAAALELLALPDLDAVTVGQARGINCVWCAGQLNAEAAVPLGHQHVPGEDFSLIPEATWDPRACRPCIRERAYRALLDHVHPGPCAECEDNSPGCEIGRALNRLVREGRRR